MSRLPFSLDATAPGTRARAATFHTLHGPVQTPVFMPVGTQATVKSQTVETLKTAGASVLLANTYHLLLRPGPAVFEKFGGIHRFMNWDRPVLTDSGGFQIFSLPHSRAMNEDGALFQSYVDGTTHLLSPETSIAMQRSIGSDIMMVLDQCIPATAPHAQARAAMELTHRWAVRSLAARGDSPQALFGIVQGACHRDLREQSAAFLRQHPFDGLAIGGLAVGETHEERHEFTALVTEQLPPHLPRYLMGVGTPLDILEAVHRGVDMFDCIIPSQVAGRGLAFTSHGRLQLRRTVYKFAEEPLDAACDCAACRHYSRAYLHHLVKADEHLGWHLLGLHNMTFYHRLTAEMRAHILRGDFAGYHARKRIDLQRTDEDHPGHAPEKPRRKTRHRRLGDYEVHVSAQGFASIRQTSSGEIMHSVSAPDEEARRLYIDQSCLAARLVMPRDAQHDAPHETIPLVIWDVGLGAAHNAMAVIHCFEQLLANSAASCPDAPLRALRPLQLVSFERDLDPLRLALKNAGRHFPHLRHAAPHRLLETLPNARWSHASGLLQWELHYGDFLAHLDTATPPDIIFYDPFSAKTDSPLWTSDTFARLRARCAANPNPAGSELYTYSNATAVRAALLTAGFHVAAGVGTGPKADTTLAFTMPGGPAAHPSTPPPRPLGPDWLARWRRSGTKFPSALAGETNENKAARAAFVQRIEQHPQFAAR
ncbi:tRNA guanosine(34) transglycosylase Tgt [Geminisphaera colitermitum]|uniref:tRNA guanosine(34) transglycosylase Tgt n=1 Tax=Geminisphaera colitermitum TaxID=1148786 RepID=UPI000158CFFC|nr:tRNA guanosine(34) transglycosylase Tgt [Geminisphaera colitermitum]